MKEEIVNKALKKISVRILLPVIGILGSIFFIPILIILLFTSAVASFGVYSLDKTSFKAMVEDPTKTCHNAQGVVMAAEWLYSIAGTRPDGTKPEGWLEYATSNGHGKSFAYGWDPRWDKMIYNYYNHYNKTYSDQREGLDCSGFVTWAFWNAGFKEVRPATNANTTKGRWGVKREPTSTAQPGDYAWREGHIGLVVEVNEKGAYVIESKGHKPDLRRTFYSFDDIDNGKANFSGLYYSKLYDNTDATCNWNISPIYASSNVIVNVKGNQISLEEYVLGVISHELDYGSNINAEALKAQAVAARSYALSFAVRGTRTRDIEMETTLDADGNPRYVLNIHDTTAGFQRYDDPLDTISEKELIRLINDVIIPTAGQVVVYNNKIIATEYSTRNCRGDRIKLPSKTHIPILFTKDNIDIANDMKASGELEEKFGKYDAYWTSRTCSHNRGMEQAGAVIMSLIADWKYTDILNYYYDEDNDMLTNLKDWMAINIEGKDSVNSTIYVGDSRTVGMCNSVSLKDNEQCIAKTGAGLSWFNNTAKPKIDSILNDNPNTTYNIIINLGVNDLYNKNKYVNLYNSLQTNWGKQNIIVTSVTPVDEAKESSHGYSVRNSTITDFNSTIENNLDSQVNYCDIYGAFTYTTTDGVHYNNSTYKKVYEALNNCKY